MVEGLTWTPPRPYGDPVTVERTDSRVAHWAARLLAVASCVLAVLAVALPLVGDLDYLDELTATPEVAVAVSFSITGAWLVGHHRARRMGWLLLAIGATSALYTVSVSWTAYVLGGDETAVLPPGSGFTTLTAWVSGWAWFPAWLMVSTVLPQVVPYGRPLPGRHWRLLAWAPVAFGCLGVAVYLPASGPVGVFTSIDNPLASATLDGLLSPLGEVLDVTFVALLGGALLSLVVRLVRADGVERRQVGWVGYAVAAVVVVVLVAPSVWVNLVVLLIPGGIAVGALRYRLYDLDLLVNRTLVAALLLGGAGLAYVALVAWVGALVGSSGGVIPFVAAFAVALAFHPARIRLQRVVDRIFHGRRGDPYALLRDLDLSLREADSPQAALVAGSALIRSGLRLPGVGLVVPLPGGGTFRHREGQLPERAAEIPLELHGEQVGELLVAPRHDRGDVADGAPALADADARVLHALAGPLASAAYALRLSGDLAESHRELLRAREDERRRLRRDLHDGLGPQLAGVVMGLDVVGSTLARGDTDRAAELASRTSQQARTAVDDVRRLVRGLRPPALDDLGLVGALEAAFAAHRESGPEVTVVAEGDPARLPAVVEVAAFRIATEAVSNAVRHAAAHRVEVALRAGDDSLSLRVVDDGRGLPETPTAGVGLASMRERAAELGGWCAVTGGERGTTVLAELPYVVPGHGRGA